MQAVEEFSQKESRREHVRKMESDRRMSVNQLGKKKNFTDVDLILGLDDRDIENLHRTSQRIDNAVASTTRSISAARQNADRGNTSVFSRQSTQKKTASKLDDSFIPSPGVAIVPRAKLKNKGDDDDDSGDGLDDPAFRAPSSSSLSNLGHKVSAGAHKITKSSNGDDGDGGYSDDGFDEVIKEGAVEEVGKSSDKENVGGDVNTRRRGQGSDDDSDGDGTKLAPGQAALAVLDRMQDDERRKRLEEG